MNLQSILLLALVLLWILWALGYLVRRGACGCRRCPHSGCSGCPKHRV